MWPTKRFQTVLVLARLGWFRACRIRSLYFRNWDTPWHPQSILRKQCQLQWWLWQQEHMKNPFFHIIINTSTLIYKKYQLWFMFITSAWVCVKKRWAKPIIAISCNLTLELGNDDWLAIKFWVFPIRSPFYPYYTHPHYIFMLTAQSPWYVCIWYYIVIYYDMHNSEISSNWWCMYIYIYMYGDI